MSVMQPFRRRWTHDANLTFLLVLIGALLFVLLPLLRGGVGRLAVDLALSVILISACYTVTSPRPLVFTTTALALAGVGLRWVGYFRPSPELLVWNLGLSVVVLTFISVLVSIWVLGPGRVTGHRIRGAVLVYLLLGLTWALAYTLVENVAPGSFTAAERPAPGDAMGQGLLREMVYYSFVTLTTLGYGDVAPVSQAARQMAVLEALVGQLFPVVFIGRVVSLEIGAVRDDPDAPAKPGLGARAGMGWKRKV